MVLLIIVMSNSEFLEELLEGFLEIGVQGATVIGAQGMGEILGQDVPIFAGLRGLFPGGEGQHRLLISVTDPAKAEEAVEMLNEVSGSIEGVGTAVAFTLPVEKTWGLANEL